MNLQTVWNRYEKALEARPSKGGWTAEHAKVLADSVGGCSGDGERDREVRAKVKREEMRL